MTMQGEFFSQACETYIAANAATLRWMLARPRLHGAFLNTKQNSISLADYGAADGLRGPDFLYGWIQGRGLESVVTHAAYFQRHDPELAVALDAAGRRLYADLDALRARHDHAFFCYDADLRPVYGDAEGGLHAQVSQADIFTYSDAFVAKGLVAGAARYAPHDLPPQLSALAEVVDAVERGRFLMAESAPLTEAALAAQPDDLGPRMILLGAAALLVGIGRREHAAFGGRFIARLIERHFDERTGLLRNVPDEDICNVGHGIEFVGFALEYLPMDADSRLLETLERILLASFRAGFDGTGIRLTVSVETLQPISPYCPWWSLPETMRAAALLYRRRPSPALLALWQQATEAFFGRYWRPEAGIAYQTMSGGKPVDYIPATPDLDPGYHTGLSLLAAVKVAEELGRG